MIASCKTTKLALVPLGDTYAIGISDMGGPTGQYGYDQMTDLSTPVGLAVPEGATQATIICEGAPVRHRSDGVAPDRDVGMPMDIGTVIVLNGDELAAFQVVEQSAGAVLNVEFEG